MTPSVNRLEYEAESSRNRISELLDELRGRISPGEVVDQVIDFASDGAGGDMVRNLGRQARQNPLALTVIGAGLAWLMLSDARAGDGRGSTMTRGSSTGGLGRIFRRTSSRARRAAGEYAAGVSGTIDDTMDEMEAGTHRVRDRLGSTVSDAAGGVSDSISATAWRASDRVSDTAGRVSDSVSEAAWRAGSAATDVASEARSTMSDATSRASDAASRAGATISDTAHSMTSGAQSMAGAASGAVRGFASAASDRLRDTVGNVRDTASGAVDAVADTASDLRDRATDAALTAGRTAGGVGRRAGTTLWHLFQEQPLVAAGLGLAIGAAIGAALPSTEAENRMLGETSDEVKRRARALAEEQAAKARRVAEQTYESAKEGVSQAAEEVTNVAKERASQVVDEATHAAEEEGFPTGTVRAELGRSRGSSQGGSDRREGQSGSMTEKGGSSAARHRDDVPHSGREGFGEGQEQEHSKTPGE
jgi:gas vesicle protein